MDTITVDRNTVAIDDLCPAVPALVRTTPDGGYVVRARWRSCGDAVRRLRLRTVVDSGCTTMSAVISVGRPFVRRHIRGARCDDRTGCPTLCRTNDDCDPGTYCAAAPGDCSSPGQCVAKPANCTQQFDPVCGCNGITYGNPCSAAGAGTRIDHAGECTTRCGGIAGIPCPTGSTCDLDPGSCDVSDAQGTCVKTGAFGCLAIYLPVCGCDGTTYNNDCERLRAGEPKAHDGECAAP